MGSPQTLSGHAVAGLALGLLVLTACGGGSTEDFVGSFRDDDAAAATYVLDGTVPDGVEAPEGVPGDRPGRIGWILTQPVTDGDWLRLGVRDALVAEPDVLADLVLGVAAVDEPLTEDTAEAVFAALGDQPASVLTAAAGTPPPADGVTLDSDAVLDALAAAGAVPDEDGAALTQPLRDLVADGLLADLQPAGDLPPDQWETAVAAADTAWAEPAARVWGSIARDVCTEEPDGERCETLLGRLVEELDRQVDQVVYETAPPAVLPAPLLLSGEREPLDDTNRDAWDAVLDGVGLDVAADVRAAAGT